MDDHHTAPHRRHLKNKKKYASKITGLLAAGRYGDAEHASSGTRPVSANLFGEGDTKVGGVQRIAVLEAGVRDGGVALAFKAFLTIFKDLLV